jgi:hypothetical protein
MMQRLEHTPYPRLRVWAVAAVLAALLGLSALALSPTQSRHAVLDQLQRPATPSPTTGLGPATAAPARFVRRSKTGYSVAVTLTPNRANGPIGLSIHVLRRGRALSGVTAQVSFSMPSMNMWNAYGAALRPSAGGRYAAAIPVLGMAGDWRLRIELTPRSGRPFEVVVDDRIAA